MHGSVKNTETPLGKKEVCSWYDCSYCHKWVPRFGCLPSLKLFSPRVTEQSQHSWPGPAFFPVDSRGGQHLRPLVPPSRQEKRVWRSQRTVSELDRLEVNAYNFCSTLWQEKPYGTTWRGVGTTFLAGKVVPRGHCTYLMSQVLTKQQLRLTTSSFLSHPLNLCLMYDHCLLYTSVAWGPRELSKAPRLDSLLD